MADLEQRYREAHQLELWQSEPRKAKWHLFLVAGLVLVAIAVIFII